MYYLRFTIYFMNLVTTQHSSNKFGSAFAAPRFSDLFYYFGYSGFRVVINFIVICCPFFHSDRTSAGIVGVSPAHLTGEARSNNDIGPSSTHIPEVPLF